MRLKSLMAAGFVAAVIVGCATLSDSTIPFQCPNSGACHVPVTVDNCVISAPDIDVPAGVNNIFWDIKPVTSPFQFPADVANYPGVWVKDDTPSDPDFDLPVRQNKHTFKLHDNHKRQKTYKYGVRVAKADGTLCPNPLDPSIVNH